MNQDSQEQFKQSLQAAVQASLRSRCLASDDLRSRLFDALSAEAARAPSGLEEQSLASFESALGQAVNRSQDWAPDDSVVLRVESAVGQAAGRDLRSEHSLHGAPDSDADPARVRYLAALRGAVKKSQAALVASAQCRALIETAVTAEAALNAPRFTVPVGKSAEPSDKGGVIPLPISERRSGRPVWKRALATTASLAAGFALIFVSLLGGADKALADSVRKDHVRCCSALSGAPMKSCASYRSSLYGELPAPPVKGWELVASRMCHDEQGGPMIHNVYFLNGKTLSIHFIPPTVGNTESTSAHAIGNGEFPVLAWEASGWTVTACSKDLSMEALVAAIGISHP